DNDHFAGGVGVRVDKVGEQVDVLVFIEQVAADDQVEQAEGIVEAGPVGLFERNVVAAVERHVALQKGERFRVQVGGGDVGVAFVQQQAGERHAAADFQDAFAAGVVVVHQVREHQAG